MAKQRPRMEFRDDFPVVELTPYQNNAKLHPDWHIAQLVQSIQRNGFNDPIGIDEDNMVVEGHGRLLAAQQMGMETVPVLILRGLTEAQKKEYILAHNKTTMNTGFDIYQLTQELDWLHDQDVDFSYLQFTEWTPPPECDLPPDLDTADQNAAVEVEGTTELNQTGNVLVKFRCPIELKNGFLDWVRTSVQGTEYEGRIEVL